MTAKFSLNHYDPNLHLFVDDKEIRQLWGVRRFLGRVTNSAEPIMGPGGPEAPWEDGRSFCPYVGSMVPDPSTGRLRMYYWCFSDYTVTRPEDYASVMMMCMAESEDGVHWQRPALGLVEWRGSKNNNIIMTGESLTQGDRDGLHDIRGPVLIDPNDDKKAFKMLAWGQNLQQWLAEVPEERKKKIKAVEGFYYLESADGLRWSVPQKIRSGGDTFAGVWDPRRKLWMWADRMSGEPNSLNYFTRLIDIHESPDLRNWTRIGRAMVLGEEGDFGLNRQLWGMFPFNYGDQYLAFLGVADSLGVGIDFVLAASRDGREYHMPFGFQRFLPLGEFGAWNGEVNNVLVNPPVRYKDRLLVYYTARNSTRFPTGTSATNYLGLASLAVDRFVGFSANQSGFILTEPVTVTGPDLYLNMQNAFGFVRVEIRDEQNRVIPGYETESCPKMHERSTAFKVQWKDKPDLRELVGRRYAFKFTMTACTLYSYRFSVE
jgi:hypothetical protein